MTRSCRCCQQQPKPIKTTSVVDERPLEKILPRSGETGDQTKPIRTVLLVEIGDLESSVAREVVQSVGAQFNNGHPHYVIATRNGKLTSDILFEKEFLNVVNELCEIRDGQIALKNGATDIDIIRRKL